MNISLFVKRLISLFEDTDKSKGNSYKPTSTQTSQPTHQKESPNQTRISPDLTREIRAQRKFTLAEAIGREGGNFMKDASAIPRPLRATAEINQFITTHFPDPSAPISTILQSWTKEDIRVSRHLDAPLIALSQIIESLLNEPTTFQEFFRQIAIAQSHLTGDRPHFQQPNQPPHPGAIYSHKSIRQQLAKLLEKVQQELI